MYVTLIPSPTVIDKICFRQAPSEAEAQCAAMCKDGLVYAMASEDMDSLTFATPRLTRNLMKPATANMPVTEYDYDKARATVKLLNTSLVFLREFKTSRDNLRQFAVIRHLKVPETC